MKRSEYVWLQARTQHSRIRYVSACFKSVNIKQKKPAWGAVRRKNGMKLLIKKASDGDLLALLGCTVSSQGMQHKCQCKRTRLGQTMSEQRCSAESCAPTRTELGTSISGFWHQLLLFYRVIQNLLMDFHLSTLMWKQGQDCQLKWKARHIRMAPQNWPKLKDLLPSSLALPKLQLTAHGKACCKGKQREKQR